MSSSRRISLAAAWLCFLLAPALEPAIPIEGATASAGVIHVPGDDATIEQALMRAMPYDTILVSPGEYRPATPLFFTRPNVTLLSESSREAFLLDVDHYFPQFIGIRAASCRIQGFYIIFNLGEAIVVSDDAVDTVIEDNYIFGLFYSPGIIDNQPATRILNNDMQYCGPPVTSSSGSVLVDSNRIHENGGGIFFLGGTVRNNVITDNVVFSDFGSPGRGGGIHAANATAPVRIEGNRIERNQTDGSDPGYGAGLGGGIYVEGCPDVVIEGNRFDGNQSLTGGALYIQDSHVAVRANLFAANHDSSHYESNLMRGIGGGAVFKNVTGIVENNTLDANIAAVAGGGIFLQGPSTPLLRANIVVRNRSAGGGVHCEGAQPAFACNDVWGNTGADYDGCGDPTGQNGNLSSDPLFCPDFFGDHVLRDDSPCAPANAPPGCGLIGAFGVGCAAAGAPEDARAIGLGVRVYPNPAHGRVRILCALPAGPPSSAVEIVDATGRRIRTLPPGPVIEWDRISGDGRRVPAGVYFVRLRDRGRVATERMLLLE